MDLGHRSARHTYQPSVSSRGGRRCSTRRIFLRLTRPLHGIHPLPEAAAPARTWSPSQVSSTTADRPRQLHIRAGRAQWQSPSRHSLLQIAGGSPRRPLPPAPLFSNLARNSSFADDATVSIPLGPEGDDVFGPESDVSDSRRERESYISQDQITPGEGSEDIVHEKVEHSWPRAGGQAGSPGVRAPPDEPEGGGADQRRARPGV